MKFNAQLFRFVLLLCLITMLDGCSVSQIGTTHETPPHSLTSYVPPAVIAQHIDFPKDEDVRKLPPEPGLSNASCGLNSIEEDFLLRVNAWRSQARYCGIKLYPAAPALRWNLKLQNASYHHSVEMARANLISHVSIDSRELWNRVRQTGYAFVLVAENIAAGQTSVEGAMNAWQKSPAHCAAMMEGKLEEIGVACIHKQSSFYKFYWTMDLASPMLDSASAKVDLEKQEKKERAKNRNPFLKVADDVKKF